jgi:hypothetical protein
MNDRKKPGMEIDEGMKTQILEQIPTPVMAVDTNLKEAAAGSGKRAEAAIAGTQRRPGSAQPVYPPDFRPLPVR